jgi:outer membrane protein assembly factor BamE (lipoprotein component of BamABCDE complex)
VKKFFIITGFILLSYMSAAAQTAAEPKSLSDARQAEYAKRDEAEATIISSKPEAGAKRVPTERVVDGRVLRVGPTTTYLKSGLSTEEVIKLLGRPSSVSERFEDGKLLSIYIFPRSESRVLIARFENGLLTASRMETPEGSER